MADYYTQQAAAQMGQLPPGAEGAPGGAERNRIIPGFMALSAWGVARSYARFTSSSLGRVAGTNRFWRRFPLLNAAIPGGKYSKGLWRPGPWPVGEGRPYFGRASFAMVASEAGVVKRLAKPSFFNMFTRGQGSKGFLGRVFGGASETSRSFVSKGIWETGLTHINLLSGAGFYSKKSLLSMGTRLWRGSLARGGGYATMADWIAPSALKELSKKELKNAVTYATGQMMPGKIADLTASLARNKFTAFGAKALTYGLPLISFYFTAKLTADIAEWSTKKILRGLNWYYFKLPAAIYRAGTMDLRAPILRSGTYIDSPGAQTNRQRAVQAIQNSRLNARSALGAEGALMHNYFG